MIKNRKIRNEGPLVRSGFWDFADLRFSSFEFVSDFEIRISDFTGGEK